MKRTITTALVAVLLATSAPAHAGAWSNFKNWSVRTFHKATGSKPTAYDRVYNDAYRAQGLSANDKTNPNNCTRSCN